MAGPSPAMTSERTRVAGLVGAASVLCPAMVPGNVQWRSFGQGLAPGVTVVFQGQVQRGHEAWAVGDPFTGELGRAAHRSRRIARDEEGFGSAQCGESGEEQLIGDQATLD